jgi:tetratricopeptide (TPR) repeat protein
MLDTCRAGTLTAQIVLLTVLIYLGASWGATMTRAEESHPGLMNEALYSEALIAFHRQQIDDAVRILDQVLASSPNYAEALELRALILKGKGDEAQALEMYQKLLTIRPAGQRAPYEYELAMIYYHQKNEVAAKLYFEKALRAGFNAMVCRFFLGTIAFNQNNNRYAEYYFSKIAKGANSELKLLALYYLGLVELRTSYPMGASRDLTAALKLAGELPPSPTTEQISTSVKQVLSPFTKSQIFANATVLGQYNSNISQLPTSLTSSSQSVSGQATGVVNLSGGVGYMTAPLADFQLVSSYHFALNLDSNSETKNYQFVTNTVSLFLNYLPLGQFQTGMKAEANLLFQDNPVDSSNASGSYQYTKYLLGGEIGPYFRYQFSRQIEAEIDLYFRPQDYFTETGLSGTNVFSRASIKADYSRNFFNPSAYVEYEHDGTNSNDFVANTVGVGVGNLLKLSPRDFVTPGVDFLDSNYPDNSLGRHDLSLAFHVDGVHIMNPHFSILANFVFTRDDSTESDVYSYSQAVVSLGVSYNL